LEGATVTDSNRHALRAINHDQDRRTPPSDLAAEQQVLGAMLTSKTAIADCADTITGPDFYRPSHEVIYDTIIGLYSRLEPVDAITTGDALAKARNLTRVGGQAYLHELINGVTVTSSAGYYAQIVAEQAVLRRLVDAGTRITALGYTGAADTDIPGLIQAAGDEIAAIPIAVPGVDKGPRRSWQPIDLTDVLDGTYNPPVATIGARADGPGLFYPGRLHTIASESEGGKTWLALTSARVELDAGNAVVYLDFEDDEGGVVGRLIALGTDRDAIAKRFAYIRPEESVAALRNRDDLAAVLNDLHPTMAVLDGVTEAMSLHGLEMKDNTEIAQFGQLLPRWIASRGPACVALDHVVKDRENRGRYAIGGVHKLNGLNGVAYVLENRTPFTIGGTGRSTVYVSKDRPGQVRRHSLPARESLWWFADLAMTSHNEAFVEVTLPPPSEQDENFRPTILMGKITAALAQHGPLSQRKILAVVKGRNTTVVGALTFLQLDGYVSDKTPHELLRPYPDREESA
jgi:hypothetical protein